jgi:stage II sporulation protein D
VPRPENSSKVFLRLEGNQVLAAFSRDKDAVSTPLSSLALRSLDHTVKIFKVAVPGLGFSREYEGTEMTVSVKYGVLALVNKLPLELYLARVLPAEMDPEHFTLEALRAQAVVARTWALMNLSRHARYGYNFCDGPHCQAYRGRKLLSRRAEQAVKMTLGEVILYQHHLAEAFYHSTCGGNTVYINEVWGGPRYPYLARVEDRWKAGNRPYCVRSPYAQWRVFTSLRRVEKGLRRIKLIAANEKLESMAVDFVNESGRVKRLLVTTDQRQFHLSIDDFRQAFDPDFSERKLLSNFFEIETSGNQFCIRGRGLGHGVGLCQWGARGMAQHGFSYQEILAHYFQGTQLGRHYGAEGSSVPEAKTPISQTGIK